MGKPVYYSDEIIKTWSEPICYARGKKGVFPKSELDKKLLNDVLENKLSGVKKSLQAGANPNLLVPSGVSGLQEGIDRKRG